MSKKGPERTVQFEVTTETRLIPIPPIEVTKGELLIPPRPVQFEVTTAPFFPERTVQIEVTKGELLPRARTTRTPN
ncbi:MAG: hypothetical protein KDF55_08885 [Thauera sp.]|mgnify:CR=1 FL=1|jgi:hypothetical protein|nr:hypothetical protein [Thauera sp.]